MLKVEILQNDNTLKDRFTSQVRNRIVNSGQYLDSEVVAQSWSTLSRKTIRRYHTHIQVPTAIKTIVDLGPGDGSPLLNIMHSLNHTIQDIILIDVSKRMINLAYQKLSSEFKTNFTGIVADFIYDSQEIAQLLASMPSPKLFLCLGFTVGNFNQKSIFNNFDILLNKEDYLIIEFPSFPSQLSNNIQNYLIDQAKFYTSNANCDFGLAWLRNCGHVPNIDNTHYIIESENDETWVIKAYYNFLNETELNYYDSKYKIYAGDSIQYVETRRYSQNKLVSYLKGNKYETHAEDHSNNTTNILASKING